MPSSGSSSDSEYSNIGAGSYSDLYSESSYSDSGDASSQGESDIDLGDATRFQKLLSKDVGDAVPILAGRTSRLAELHAVHREQDVAAEIVRMKREVRRKGHVAPTTESSPFEDALRSAAARGTVKMVAQINKARVAASKRALADAQRALDARKQGKVAGPRISSLRMAVPAAPTVVPAAAAGSSRAAERLLNDEDIEFGKGDDLNDFEL